MLPFIAHPKRYTRSGVTRYCVKHLESISSETSIMVRLLESGLWMASLAGAMIAIFLPIYTLQHVFAFYIPVILLDVFLSIRVLAYTVALGGREREKSKWDDVILTDLDASQLVLGKWWAVIRFFKNRFIGMIFLRFFSAYGFACYFLYLSSTSCSLGLNAFCYGLSGGGPYPHTPPVIAIQPLLPMYFILISISVIGIYTILELLMLSGLGIFASLLVRRNSGFLWAVSIRFLMCMVGLEILLLGGQWFKLHHVGSGIDHPYIYRYKMFEIVESVQIMSSALMDNGILVASNFLRGQIRENNTLEFLTRNAIACTFGMLAFVGLIWLFLRKSIDLSIKQGADVPDYLHP